MGITVDGMATVRLFRKARVILSPWTISVVPSGLVNVNALPAQNLLVIVKRKIPHHRPDLFLNLDRADAFVPNPDQPFAAGGFNSLS